MQQQRRFMRRHPDQPLRPQNGLDVWGDVGRGVVRQLIDPATHVFDLAAAAHDWQPGDGHASGDRLPRGKVAVLRFGQLEEEGFGGGVHGDGIYRHDMFCPVHGHWMKYF